MEESVCLLCCLHKNKKRELTYEIMKKSFLDVSGIIIVDTRLNWRIIIIGKVIQEELTGTNF